MIRSFFQLLLCIVIAEAGHYKGGTITWKVVDPNSTASMVSVIISQSHSWTLSRLQCNQALINSLGWYTDGGGAFTGEPYIRCQVPVASCTSSGFTTISQRTYCTDFSPAVQSSSGALITTISLSRNTNMIIGFDGFAWASVIKPSSGALSGYWSVVTKIDLTQRFPFNTSPVTGSLPIIRVIEGRQAVIQIPAADWDTSDDVRCRWASATGPAGNECADICSNLPGATISLRDCTITWNAVRHPTDISAGILTSSYIAAIMVEDFINTTATVPMSSVPLQMVIFTYQLPAGACNTVPAVIGDRPNRACIGVPIGQPLTERIVATVYCSGDSITELLTISPLYMSKTALARVPGTTNQWFITLTWTPTIDQKGPQVFCAAPIDQRGLTGSQHCINFVVGYAAPNLIMPVLVQGSASPLGTVFSNHSVFSIQASGGVYKPNRNGTYVRIYNRANPFVPEWEADCGYSPSCIYRGSTVVFYVPNANWTEGGYYYVLLDSGAASGNVFCAPESSPILDPNFWVFNIWNPGRSSTTTTTTTAPTTATVTTRGISTTTPIANLTTTGLVATSPTTQTTTSVTTATTTTTVTTAPWTTVPQGTTTTPMDVVSMKELEEYCRAPIGIMNAVTMISMAPINFLGMFVIFTKIEKAFNPARVAANLRRVNRSNKIRTGFV